MEFNVSFSKRKNDRRGRTGKRAGFEKTGGSLGKSCQFGVPEAQNGETESGQLMKKLSGGFTKTTKSPRLGKAGRF